MSTTLLERPVEPAAGGGTRHARRAVVRWAWRLFRREWRQQLLVLALLTTAVAATVLGAAVATNTPPPRNAGFGTADHLITLPGAACDRASADRVAAPGGPGQAGLTGVAAAAAPMGASPYQDSMVRSSE